MYLLYGARAINASLKEEGLHLETKDYDFLLCSDSAVAFEALSQELLAQLAELPDVGHAVVGDLTTPGYCHISVHGNRVVDLSQVSTADTTRWLQEYGAPSLLQTPVTGSPPVAVMPLRQLHDRLVATTTRDLNLAQKCFPSGFDPRNVPPWRLDKDRRQLQRITIAQRLSGQ